MKNGTRSRRWASTCAEAHLKARRALEEELPLLRKEETETRQVDLLLVGLDLGEVGAIARIEQQR